MANYVPTIRRRRLGSALRRLREEAGLTATEVGERLSWSHSKISRIETSKTPVTSADVVQLLAHYEIASDKSEALLKLAREAKQRDGEPIQLDAVIGEDGVGRGRRGPLVGVWSAVRAGAQDGLHQPVQLQVVGADPGQRPLATANSSSV